MVLYSEKAFHLVALSEELGVFVSLELTQYQVINESSLGTWKSTIEWNSDVMMNPNVIIGQLVHLVRE